MHIVFAHVALMFAVGSLHDAQTFLNNLKGQFTSCMHMRKLSSFNKALLKRFLIKQRTTAVTSVSEMSRK